MWNNKCHTVEEKFLQNVSNVKMFFSNPSVFVYYILHDEEPKTELTYK